MQLILTVEQIAQAIREYVVSHKLLPQGNYNVDQMVWNIDFNLKGVQLVISAVAAPPQQQQPQQPAADPTRGLFSLPAIKPDDDKDKN